MIVDFIDFKTVNLISKLDTGIGAELSLSQEGKVSAKRPEEWSGYVVIYLNIKIHDKDDTYADSDYQNGIYRIHNAQRL